MQFWLPVIISIVALVTLITVLKLQPFLAFLLVSISLGLVLGLDADRCLVTVQNGMGSTLGSILPILVPGAMIGKLVSESNATLVISEWLVTLMGRRRLPFAFMCIGFLVGLPLFYSVAFLLLVPIVLATAEKYGLPPLKLGIPLLASLSITQGYLPPHPAPYYLVTHLPGADMGITLGLGILISIPAMLISGLWFARTIKPLSTKPMLFIHEENRGKMPPLGISLGILLLPVLLIGLHAFLKDIFRPNSAADHIVRFAGQPVVALLISLAGAIYFLGIKRDVSWKTIQRWLSESIKEVSPLILTFAGAGAFKEVLQELKVGPALIEVFGNGSLNILVFAWIIAALIRIITGSSTVSGITTAGLIVPLLASHPVNANLLALSIGSGSMVLSHVNDTGFWLFRDYFGVSLKDTLKTWTVMETLIAFTGLGGVLLLKLFLG